jgi:hypothetical protein
MVVFDGPDGQNPREAVIQGQPEGTAVLNTEHSPRDGRVRVRWEYQSKAKLDAPPGCSATTPCLNVVARSFPTSSGSAGILRTDQAANWEGAGLGLDRWAVESAARTKSYPRDTRGDAAVSSCKAPTSLATDDLDGNKRLDEYEFSKASERATTSLDQVREWELGGWKSAAGGAYQAAIALFPGWEDGRGGWDCEPLQRGFGPPTESWGSYFSFSLNDGWKLSG